MGFAGDENLIQAIPNSYIVVVKPDTNDRDLASHIDSIKSQLPQTIAATSQKKDLESFSFQPSEALTTASLGESPYILKGYTGVFPPSILQTIKESPEVIKTTHHSCFYFQKGWPLTKQY
jgi:hypothetical protein